MVGMTSDKRIVWNQQGVAMAFGFDRLYDEKSFTKEERMGVKKRVGDYPFLQQCAEKIAEEIAGSGDSSRCFFQLVTYSGHGPFIIPDEYKRISFSPGMPEVLNNYLTAANYTDYAIGKFIERLQEEGLFDETMIVVTGDHEGLAYLRQSLCETKEGGGLVSPFEYTPFIVINSPVGMRYEKVMGQVDIYSTLLDLTGLDDYGWKGMGQSILDSLAKALKQACGEKGRMVGMTSDKRIVWNQQGVAMAFGFDRLYDEKSFTKEERMGVKKRVGDYPFLQQCAEKIAEEIAGSGDSSRCFFQLVTYSGHGPFIIPDEYKRISFSPGMPEVLNNYLTAANYTDYAIGKFIERLQEEGLFDETMIVVTGDHEGLAYLRQSLCETKEGGGLVSPFEYTPFIVINSPVGMRYEKVMGQVDIYSTLLDLTGLDDYGWKGMGQSILDPSHLGVAAIWNLTIAGDTTGICPEAIERMKQSWRISDLMIRGDYFRSDF